MPPPEPPVEGPPEGVAPLELLRASNSDSRSASSWEIKVVEGEDQIQKG